MINKINYNVYLIFLTILLTACAAHSGIKPSYERVEPIHKIESHSFDPASSVMSRVASPSIMVLHYLKQLDGKDDYFAYIPSSKELNVIDQCLAILPPLTKKILKERLLGISFVENFLGSGLADWVIDREGKIYVFLVFNPFVLKKNLHELLTYKEQTCFADKDQSIDIRFDVGTTYSGFLYILLHESTHVVDYVEQGTPYLEPHIKKILSKSITETAFTRGTWRDYDKPFGNFPFRKKVSFYGFNKGPLANDTDAVWMYQRMKNSPFVTLYASMTWSEDLAEFVTFYHLTQRLGQKFVNKVIQNGTIIFEYEPMKAPQIIERFKTIEYFYR